MRRKGLKIILVFLILFASWGILESAIEISRSPGTPSAGQTLALLAFTVGLDSAIGLALGLIFGLTWMILSTWKPFHSARDLDITLYASALALAMIGGLHAVWASMIFLTGLLSPFKKILIFGFILVLTLGLGLLLALIVQKLVQKISGRKMGWGWRLPFLLLGISLLLLITALARTQFGRSRTAHGPLPNIMVITIDTLRADHTSPYGYEIKTPNLDAVSREGVTFLNTIAPIPVTGPSHASLFTSLMPGVHGSRINGMPLDREVGLLSEILHKLGYRTAAVVSGYPLKKYNAGLHRGFDLYDDQLGRYDRYSHALLIRILDRGHMLEGVERKAGAVTEAGLRWLRANKGGPFFIWLHYFDPHTLYEPPAPYDHLYARNDRQVSLYDGEISYVDSQIGECVRWLKTEKLYDDLFLVITSDHGESLGEHEYYYDHGKYLYDDSIKIPLFFRCPGKIPAGRRVQSQVRLIDVMPTMLSLLKVPIIGSFQGRDLSPLFIQEDEEDVLAISETFFPEAPEDKKSIRSNFWKLIHSPKNNSFELYDLRTDAPELNNCVEALPSKFAELRTELERQTLESRVIRPADLRKLSPRQIEKLKSLGYLK